MTPMNPLDRSTRPDARTELRWITRDEATRWLENHNTGNRNMAPTAVLRWTNIFNLGRYRLTHQGFAFDTDGVLRDGQHRCAGFVNSTRDGFWSFVTTGLEPDSFLAMDTGLTRRANQFLDGTNRVERAAAAALLTKFPEITFAPRKIENLEIVEIADGLPAMAEAANIAKAVYRQTRISATLHTALLTVVLSSDVPRSTIEAWAAGLETGSGLEDGDPRLALRNRFMVERFSGDRSGRRAALYLIVRAWNAYINGERMTRLQLPRSDADQRIPRVEV